MNQAVPPALPTPIATLQSLRSIPDDELLKRASLYIRQLKCQEWSNRISVDLFYTLRAIYDRSTQEPSSPSEYEPLVSPEEERQAHSGPEPCVPPQHTRVRKKPPTEPLQCALKELLISEDVTLFLSRKLFAYPDSTQICNAMALLMLITNQFEYCELQKRIAADRSVMKMLIKCIDAPSIFVQFWCIGVIRNLARNEECVQIISEENGIDPLVDKLAKDVIVRGIAASALANLAYDNDENRRLISARGGIELLIQVIASTNNKQTLWEATGALGNLSYKAEENKDRIVRAGGIPLLIKLLDVDAEDVVGTAASTLENLCSNSEEYRIKCAQAGAITKLIALLNSDNVYVQDGSCGALFNLSINIDNRNKIVEQGAIPLVLKLLYSPSEDVVYRATGVLHNISCDNQLTSSQIDDVKALPRIIELLSVDNEYIQENASGTLMNLGCVDSKAIQIAKCGGITALISLLNRTTQDQVAYRVAGAMFNICFSHKENKQVLVAQGGLKPLMRAVMRSTHTKVLEYSLGTINMITADIPEAADAIAAENFFREILGLLTKEYVTPRMILEIRGILSKLAESVDRIMKYAFLPNIISFMRACHEVIAKNVDNIDEVQAAAQTAFRELCRAAFATAKQVLDQIKSTMEPAMTLTVNTFDELKGFDEFVNCERYHDVVLVVGGQPLYAHKVILCSRSSYFKAMLERWVPSNQSNMITIDADVHASTFVELLRFIYTGTCNVTSDNAVALLELADLYNLENLTALCEKHILASVTPQNLLQLLEVAVHYNARRLHTALVSYAINYCDILADMPPAHLLHLLAY